MRFAGKYHSLPFECLSSEPKKNRNGFDSIIDRSGGWVERPLSGEASRASEEHPCEGPAHLGLCWELSWDWGAAGPDLSRS